MPDSPDDGSQAYPNTDRHTGETRLTYTHHLSALQLRLLPTL